LLDTTGFSLWFFNYNLQTARENLDDTTGFSLWSFNFNLRRLL